MLKFNGGFVFHFDEYLYGRAANDPEIRAYNVKVAK